MDIGDFLSDVVDNVSDNVSDVVDGAKDVLSDLYEGAVDVFTDVGEKAQQTLENLGEGTVEALKEGDLEKAIEQSDLPAESKAEMQEVRQAFELDKGKMEIVKDGVKALTWGAGSIASLVLGHVPSAVFAGMKAAQAGGCLWNSVSQMRDTSQNAQSQKLAQMA